MKWFRAEPRRKVQLLLNFVQRPTSNGPQNAGRDTSALMGSTAGSDVHPLCISKTAGDS